jgi:hypothetical protein
MRAGGDMRRFVVLVVLLAGCSTHPVPATSDSLCPHPTAPGPGGGGVCLPSTLGPGAPSVGPVGAGSLPPPPEPPIIPR